MSNVMRGVVRWQQDVRFQGESSRGHTVLMDGPEDAGGKDAGFRPMELLLMGVGGCTSFDVVQILKKSKQDIHACWVEIEAERRDEVPQVFTRIHLKFVLEGRSLSEARVERAIALSAEKYCSASMMLEAGGVAVSHSHELREVQ